VSAPVLVIGIGNSLRGDDAAGLEVARRLRADAGLTVIEHEGEAIALLDSWRAARALIVVDTVRSGAAPGAIHRIDASERPVPLELRRTSSHAIGVADAIELARTLRGLPAKVIVYGVEGAVFDAGAPLSDAVAGAIETVADAVRREARSLAAAG
jgi:hydrogenase maturation protease